MSAQTPVSIADERSRLLTLVFTDLVNSVGLKIQLGDVEAGRLISAHHDGLRELLSATGGREILVAGDGSFLTFETPSQAVEFALRLQDFHHKNQKLPAVRIGIHMGEVTETLSDDSARPVEVAGLAVDIASRIQSLASARQILMSYPVFDNARQRISASAFTLPLEWRAHGRYLFKGADATLEIFEVGLLGIAAFKPPSGSTKASRDVLGEEEATLGWRPAQGLDLPDRPNWILLEKLGEGGFGDVWLVEHRKTRERHVIKFCYSTDRLRALKREVTLFRLLKETLGDRTDIARVIDYQFDSAPYFLEMEFAGHYNLTTWLDEQGGVNAIPLETRVELVAQIAEAIAAAHSVGVLHKDIKPSNIMITETGARPRIRMIDFGIGAVSDRNLLDIKGITATGLTEVEISSDYASSMAGTRLYMAPELIEGKAATTKSDVYSLGVLLYQMVAGKIGQTLSFGWERDIPDELLRQDIEACVDGRPENRLLSAEELAKRLRMLPERRKALEAERQAVIRRESSRRRRRLYIVAAMLLAVLTVFAAQFAFLQKQKAEAAEILQKKAEAARAEALEQANQTRIALTTAKRAHYFGAIALAEASLRESRLDKVQEVLFNEAPAEFRNLEWGWLLEETSPEDMAIKNSNFFDTKFTSGGETFVAGSRDGAGKGYVSIYDSATGQRLQTIKTNERLVWNLDVSPDERLAATASSDNVVTIVDLHANQIVHTITSHTAILRDVKFSPDGKLLATCSRDHSIGIWDTENFGLLQMMFLPEDSLTEIAFSPDSKYLVSGSLEHHARVFDVTAGEQVAMLAGHTDRVLSVTFLADNSGIATACTDGETRIFPWSTEQIPPVIEPRISVRTRDSYPAQVVSSPKGKYVYIGNDNGSIKKLSVDTGFEHLNIQVDQPLWKIDLCPDTRRLMVTTRWSIRLLDMERLEGDSVTTEWADMATTPANAQVIDLATVVKIRDTTWNYDTRWQTTSGLSLFEFKDRKYFTQSPYHVYSPDRTEMIRIYPSTLGGRVVSTKMRRVIRAFPGDVIVSAAYSPDGNLAAVATQNAGTRVYNVASWEVEYQLPRNPNGPSAIKFSSDSKLLIVGNVDGAIESYDMTDGSLIRQLVKPGKSAVLSLDISNDGQLLAAGLDNDRAIVLNLNSGDQISTMSGHVRYVHALKFAPGGERLATLSRDGTVKLWDAKSGRELVTLFNLPQGVVPLGISFAPDMQLISIATSDRRILKTEVFPWDSKIYGGGDQPLTERIEQWKRRKRLGIDSQM